MSVYSSVSRVVMAIATVFVAGCAQTSSPTTASSFINGTSPDGPASGGVAANAATGRPMPSGRPDYELAYYNGTIVTMNHIEVPQNPGALAHAAADLYAVSYPANHALWP